MSFEIQGKRETSAWALDRGARWDPEEWNREGHFPKRWWWIITGRVDIRCPGKPSRCLLQQIWTNHSLSIFCFQGMPRVLHPPLPYTLEITSFLIPYWHLCDYELRSLLTYVYLTGVSAVLKTIRSWPLFPLTASVHCVCVVVGQNLGPLTYAKNRLYDFSPSPFGHSCIAINTIPQIG